MPIPPRPIPRRPGLAVPRKLPASFEPTRDLSALADLVPRPSSAASSARGLMMAPAKPSTAPPADRYPRRDHVGLDELLAGGKGRREKRVTTASELGFDFVKSPTVVVLDDDAAAGDGVGTAVLATPALEAAADGDDDWEHVDLAAEHDADADADMIFIGELELDDVEVGKGVAAATGGAAGMGAPSAKASYAAAAKVKA